MVMPFLLIAVWIGIRTFRRNRNIPIGKQIIQVLWYVVVSVVIGLLFVWLMP